MVDGTCLQRLYENNEMEHEDLVLDIVYLVSTTVDTASATSEI